jgi:hypothetical protein
MMCSESNPKFLLWYHVSSRLHGAVVIPPNTGGTMELLGSEVSLIGVRTWNRKKSKLGFNGAKPSISIKGLLNFDE